jgi:hypothetical protein
MQGFFYDRMSFIDLRNCINTWGEKNYLVNRL